MGRAEGLWLLWLVTVWTQPGTAAHERHIQLYSAPVPTVRTSDHKPHQSHCQLETQQDTPVCKCSLFNLLIMVSQDVRILSKARPHTRLSALLLSCVGVFGKMLPSFFPSILPREVRDRPRQKSLLRFSQTDRNQSTRVRQRS